MTEQQWKEVESIVRREQQKALQNMNTTYYSQLSEILDNLHSYTHPTND